MKLYDKKLRSMKSEETVEATEAVILSEKEFKEKLIADVKAKADAEYKEYLKTEQLKLLHTDLNFATVEDLIAKLLEVNNITSYSNKQSSKKRETVNAGSTEKIRELARAGKTVSETLNDLKTDYPNLRYQNVRQVYVQLEAKGESVRFK